MPNPPRPDRPPSSSAGDRGGLPGRIRDEWRKQAARVSLVPPEKRPRTKDEDEGEEDWDMTILTLMRHPPIEAMGERCIGQTNVKLSPEGREALIPLAEEASRLRPDKILCSDLQRCQLLAEAIALRLGLSSEPDPVWREVNFGTWESRTWSDIQAEEPHRLSEWMANFETVAPPTGESFADLQARVLRGIENTLVGARHDAAVSPTARWGPNRSAPSITHYLIVTHAGVIRAAMSAFSDLPLRRAFELRVPYGSHASFCRHGSRWTPMDIVTGERSLPREDTR
jgi:alpha-ribazole phosphatase